MAIDFPTSPTAGQEFTPPGGPTYVWVSPRWIAKSGATAETFNRVVNGAFQVSQENGTTVIGANAYPADQWLLQAVSSSTVNAARVAGNAVVITTSPAETAAAAAEYIMLTQRLEGIRFADFGWGTGSAKAAVLAFDISAQVAGTYWVSFRNGGGTHSYLASYTVSAGDIGVWARKTVVIPAGAINAGTWAIDTGIFATMHLTLHCGSTATGVAGLQATPGLFAGPGQALSLSTAIGVYITNVGLYRDPSGTGVAPPFVMPDEADELAACQRYYARQYCSAIVSNTTGFYAISTVTFPVTMRVVPASANITTGTITGCVVNGDNVSGTDSGYLQIQSTATHGSAIGRLNAYSARM